MKEVIKASLKNSMSYQAYRKLVSDLLKEGKSTGTEQSEEITNYSKLNDQRMKRWDKRIKLTEEVESKIKAVEKEQTWLVLTEGWCGDAAHNIPVINKLAELNENIELKIVLRDNNLALMDLFLTNGGRSIPKLIAIDKDEKVLFSWGPRPEIATKMVLDYKAEHGVVDAALKENLQVWYNKNKGLNVQEDIIKLAV